MTMQIELTQGAFATVDDADFEWLNNRGSWHLDGSGKNFYAVRNFWTTDRRCRKERMHRLLVPGVPIVDHINGDTLDNRRSNLRAVTDRQSAFNRGKRSNSSWKYKGIGHKPGRHPWRAAIQVRGVKIHLGSYMTADEAAHAYDRAALIHFGEFARLNFPKDAA